MKRFLKAFMFLCVVATVAALLLKAGVAEAAGAALFKQLNAVAAVSAHNIWAVGYSISGSGEQPLIEHWNGRQWSIVASAQLPAGFNGGVLSGIEEISAHNIWAVGQPLGSGPSFTEHWDGKQWSIVAAPAPTGSEISTLFEIAGVSAHDVWTVGYYIGQGGIDRTLIEHWDGTKWSIIPSPNSGPNADDALDGVAAISPNNVWAVGSNMNIGSTPEQSLIEHWDGVQWSIVPSAN